MHGANGPGVQPLLVIRLPIHRDPPARQIDGIDIRIHERNHPLQRLVALGVLDHQHGLRTGGQRSFTWPRATPSRLTTSRPIRSTSSTRRVRRWGRRSAPPGPRALQRVGGGAVVHLVGAGATMSEWSLASRTRSSNRAPKRSGRLFRTAAVPSACMRKAPPGKAVGQDLEPALDAPGIGDAPDFDGVRGSSAGSTPAGSLAAGRGRGHGALRAGRSRAGGLAAACLSRRSTVGDGTAPTPRQ